MLTYLRAAFLALCWLPTAVHAQSKNAELESAIQARNHGPVSVTRMVRVPYQRTVCRGVRENRDCYDVTDYRNEPRTSNELLSIGAINIVRAEPFRFGAPIRTALPHEATIEDKTYVNCTAAPTTKQSTFALTFVRSASTQVTKTVTNTTGSTLGFGGLAIGPFTLAGAINITDSRTDGTVNTLGTNETVSHNHSETIIVPGQSVYLAELRHYPIDLAVPFETKVLVDADLSANNAGLTRLSQIVSDSARTYEVAGLIHASDASGATFRLLERPITAADCAFAEKIRVLSKVPIAAARDTLQVIREKRIDVPKR
jgi:hypothetical protein